MTVDMQGGGVQVTAIMYSSSVIVDTAIFNLNCWT